LAGPAPDAAAPAFPAGAEEIVVPKRPLVFTAGAIALAAGAAAIIAGLFGFESFLRMWARTEPAWLLALLGAELLTFPAYLLAYRAVARGENLDLPLGVSARLVIHGFGPAALRGGFALDTRALQTLGLDTRVATRRVLALGALEWMLLAPAAWVAAVVLLAEGGSPVMRSVLWPWAIAVPLGSAAAFALASPERVRRLARGSRPARTLATLLDGLVALRSLSGKVLTALSALIGMALYWALDMASLYAAMRFFGMRPGLGETILGYATGYALTRRSMPLAGAAVTEALMTFSLHWVGQPVPAALAAVIVYRSFNVILPALLSWPLSSRPEKVSAGP
jgi:uncharacterized membrane protein YbhN (UPF0104 family)